VDRILVLTPHEDRAGRATHLACELATRTGASVTLVRVLEESLGAGQPLAGAGPRSIREMLTEIETRRVGELAERFRDRGISVSVEVRWGVAGAAVVDLVERDGIDLVVKPATGLSRNGRLFFGATALHLFRRCPCPVWVVGQEGRLPSRIVAAVDPQGTPQRQAAATRILEWADRVGDWTDGLVHIASAWEAVAADLLRDEVSAEEWKAYVDDARSRAERDLTELLAARDVPSPPDRIHLLEGPVVEALPRFAEEQDADLIVMGTLGREGAMGDLLGETAETIIRQIRSSVLTIPPPARTPRPTTR